MYSPVLHSLIVYYYAHTLKKFNNASNNLAVIFFQTFSREIQDWEYSRPLNYWETFPEDRATIGLFENRERFAKWRCIVTPSSSGHHPTGENAMDRS